MSVTPGGASTPMAEAGAPGVPGGSAAVGAPGVGGSHTAPPSAMTRARARTSTAAPGRIPSGRPAALSVSRAKEYERCPLQFRLHVVDGMRDPATRATAAGTLIHSVLEHLFDLAPADRTLEAARADLRPRWAEQRTRDTTVRDLFESEAEEEEWLDSLDPLLAGYFGLEDPRNLAPYAREQWVEAITEDGIRLCGVIDRVDRAPDGAVRIVDYKTGRAPSGRYMGEALEQMRFYSLMFSLTDRLPARTQLLYLRSGKTLTFDPVAEDVRAFSGHVSRVWEAIEADCERGHFAPRRNPLCNWCQVRAHCPLFDGTPPEIDEARVARLRTVRAR